MSIETLEDRWLLASLPISTELSHGLTPQIDFGVPFHRAEPIDSAALIQRIENRDANDRLELELFAGESYSASIQSKTIDINGTVSMAARIDGFDYAYSFITITGEQILVSVDIPEKGEKYVTRRDPASGDTFLLQLDVDQLDELLSSEPITLGDHHEEASSRSSRDSGSVKSDAATRLSGPDQSPGITQIDVMVVYTPAASNWANNAEGSILNTIAAAMTRSNTASENSDLGITFNLVYSGEVDYVESGSSSDLSRLRGMTDGFMDEVHAIRDNVAADMVAILTFTQDTGGVAYLLTSRYGREDLAFSLTRVQQASWTYTFVHELAHNMGASHHKEQNVQSGPTNWSDWPENVWSAGWRWQGDNGNYYTSVMAYASGQFYADGNNSVRVPYFSNPNVLFQGQPTGHPVDGDNARTLREVRQFIGQYRDFDTLQYCTAQGGASNYGISSVHIGSIQQPSGTSGYYDFSFLHADVRAGVPEQLTVTVNNPFWSNQLLVWVDWNDNKDFSDPGELVFTSSQGAVAQYNVSITPPAGVQPGPKRMRIRLHMPSFGGNPSPCGGSDFGEVQDFKLNVLPPEAEVTGSFVYHTDWDGSFENSIDSSRTLAVEGPEPETLSLANLLNNSSGITGLAFEIESLLGGIGASDLVFQWSPQGAFQESQHPPASWSAAPEPSLIVVEHGQPDRLRVEWPQGTVMNRWLRFTIDSNANTGLAQPAVFYIGHLLGETTGPNLGTYTATFADISEIRAAVGQSVDASSSFDIDKNGIISFADISAMRSNVGQQLTNITIGGSQSGQSSLSGRGGSVDDDSNQGSNQSKDQDSRWILQNSLSEIPSSFNEITTQGPTSETLWNDNPRRIASLMEIDPLFVYLTIQPHSVNSSAIPLAVSRTRDIGFPEKSKHFTFDQEKSTVDAVFQQWNSTQSSLLLFT